MRLIRLLKGELAGEISAWVEQKIISVQQAEAIGRLYGVEYGKKQNRAYAILTVLGYLFVGLAAIVLIGHNWEDLSRELRMGGLLILTLGTQGIAFKHYCSGRVGSATGLFFLGNFFYGASIILIAQIYHLGEHYPDGIFWWAAGSLPFGVLLLSPWLTLFSLLLALLWFVMEWELGFPPVLFPLFLSAAAYVLFKGRQSVMLFLVSVFSMLLWLEYFLFPGRVFDLHAEHFAFAAAFFIFAYAASARMYQTDSTKAKDYSVLLSLWTLRFALIIMLVLSFEDPWKELITANWNYKERLWSLITLLIGASLWLGWKSKKLPILVPFTAFFLVSFFAVLGTNSADAIYFKVVYNIALITMGIGLILRGFKSGVSHYFYLGIAVILLTAFIRYIDLIGDYIGGAALFMAFAVLLLVSARFWKKYENQSHGS